MILYIGPTRIETDLKLHYPEDHRVAVGSLTVSPESLVVIDKIGQDISLSTGISFLTPRVQSLIRNKKIRDQWTITILYQEQSYTGPIRYEWSLNRVTCYLTLDKM